MRKTIGIINMILGAVIAVGGAILSFKYNSLENSETHKFILYLVVWVGLGVLLFLIGNNFRKPRKRIGSEDIKKEE